MIPLTVFLSLSLSLFLYLSFASLSPFISLSLPFFLSLSLSLPPSLHLSVSLFQSFSLSVSLSFLILSLSPFLFRNFRFSAFRSQIGQGNGTDGGLIGYNPMYGHDQSTGGKLTSHFRFHITTNSSIILSVFIVSC